MGLFSDICDAVSSCFSSFTSSVSTSMGPILGPMIDIGLLLEALKVIAAIIKEVCVALGIIEDEDDLKDLGDKAIQSGYKPEDYESNEEYLEALRNYKLDPEMSAKTSEAEKLAAGIAVSVRGLEEKYDIKFGDFLKDLPDNKNFYTPERIEKYVKEFSAAGVDLSKLSLYNRGGLEKQEDINKVESTLFNAERKINPGISDGEIEKLIDSAKK